MPWRPHSVNGFSTENQRLNSDSKRSQRFGHRFFNNGRQKLCDAGVHLPDSQTPLMDVVCGARAVCFHAVGRIVRRLALEFCREFFRIKPRLKALNVHRHINGER